MLNAGCRCFLLHPELQIIVMKDFPVNYKLYLMLLVCARWQASEHVEMEPREIFTLQFEMSFRLFANEADVRCVLREEIEPML